MGDQFAEVVKYMKKNGGFMHDDIEYKTVNGVGGVYAKKDLPADTELGSAPNKISIIYDLTNKKEIINVLKNYKKYKPYIDSFPCLDFFKKYHPFFYDEKTQSKMSTYLSSTHTLSHLDQFKQLKELYPDEDEEILQHAFILHITRSWGLGNNRGIMVPGIDCMNHSSTPNSLVYLPDDDKEYTRFTSTNPIKKGEQITITYGNKSVGDLFFSYGFLDKSLTNTVQLGNGEFNITLKLDSALEYYNIYNLKNKYNIKLNIDDNNKISFNLNKTDFYLGKHGVSPSLLTFLTELYGSEPKAWSKVHETVKIIKNYLVKIPSGDIQVHAFDENEKELLELIKEQESIISGCIEVSKQNLSL